MKVQRRTLYYKVRGSFSKLMSNKTSIPWQSRQWVLLIDITFFASKTTVSESQAEDSYGFQSYLNSSKFNVSIGAFKTVQLKIGKMSIFSGKTINGITLDEYRIWIPRPPERLDRLWAANTVPKLRWGTVLERLYVGQKLLCFSRS